jgi:hypothetical protein
MPLIRNAFTRTSTEFFLNHTPFPVGENEDVIDLLADMYSINVIPTEDTVVINDGFGLENTFEFTISIKNLTNNVTLIADIEYGDFFIKDIADGNVILLPKQTVNLMVKADRNKLDNQPTAGLYDSSIAVTIRNPKSSVVAIKNMLTPTLSQYSLPKEITIV